MFRKLLLSVVFGLLLLSFGTVVGAEEKKLDDDAQILAGNMTPASQSIYGGTASATWSMTWTGNGPWTVSFKPDSPDRYVVTDANTNATGINHTHTYHSSQSYVRYSPAFMAVDSNGNLSADNATVYKFLR